MDKYDFWLLKWFVYFGCITSTVLYGWDLPSCRIVCSFNLCFVVYFLGQTGQEWGIFSYPVWVYVCFYVKKKECTSNERSPNLHNLLTFKALLVLKGFPQISQTHLISWTTVVSEWQIFLCKLNDCFMLYALSQFSASQGNCFLSDLLLCQPLICRLNPDHLLNAFPHILHTHG